MIWSLQEYFSQTDDLTISHFKPSRVLHAKEKRNEEYIGPLGNYVKTISKFYSTCRRLTSVEDY